MQQGFLEGRSRVRSIETVRFLGEQNFDSEIPWTKIQDLHSLGGERVWGVGLISRLVELQSRYECCLAMHFPMALERSGCGSCCI